MNALLCSQGHLSGECFLDCPGWALECGHGLSGCAPECWGWGGVEVVPHGYADLAARLVVSGLLSTPASRAGRARDGAA